MTSSRTLRRALGILCAVVGASLGTTPALAATATAPAPVAPLESCDAQTMSQPFLEWKDSNFYALAPGGAFDALDGSGWDLQRGASIVSTTQPDGSVGGVLDLPSKSQATSPPVCITADYPTARLWVRNVAGSEGVYFNIQYLRNGVWTSPKDNGQFHGAGKSVWTLSNPMNVMPDKTTGWQQVRFTFLAGGNTSRFQVNDFWIDPRMRF
jgi:hypothetical protein